jgi:peptide/nickel transport system permease protein
MSDRGIRFPSGIVGLVLIGTAVLTAVLANLIAPHDPFSSVGSALAPPSWEHPMGTDDLGRDIVSGVVHGARTSLLVMAVALAIASAIGILLGAIAALRGGLVDDLLMRLTEVFQSMPRLFLAVLVVALFGSGVELIAIVLGLTSWTRIARVVRAEILGLKGHYFVEAARSLGARELRILFHHLLPNALSSAVVVIALLGASVILVEASLSFLGLGDPASISWGAMIRNGQRFLRSAWWMTTFPGLAIVLTAVGVNLFADSLNDRLDPLRARPLGRLGMGRLAIKPTIDPTLLPGVDDAAREAERLPADRALEPSSPKSVPY